MNKTDFDRLLAELREPVTAQQVERASARVLDSLEAGERQRLTISVPLAEQHSPWSWRVVAATAAAMAIAAMLQFVLLPSGTHEKLARSINGRTYGPGEAIRARNEAMHLLLRDGSRIEMNPEAVLSVTADAHGMRIFLDEGHVIVTAAKQPTGRLLVQTRDCEISVVGTVFSVSAGPKGSRISVVEGEVQVRQGDRTQTLLPGQQTSTSGDVKSVPVKDDIAWSSNATQLVALLHQQQTAPAQPPATTDEPGTVRGIVFGVGTSEGIPGVTIGICPEPEQPSLVRTDDGRVFNTFVLAFSIERIKCENTVVATSDDAGRFVIRDVLPGRYLVRAQKSGYLAPLTIPNDPPGVLIAKNGLDRWSYEGGPTLYTQSVVVTGEPRAAAANLNLARLAKVTGKVRNEDGKLAGYVPVQLGVAAGTGAEAVFKSLSAVNTNASGDYQFRLPPGEYLLFAGSLGKESPTPIPSTEVLRISVKEGEDLALDPINSPK